VLRRTAATVEELQSQKSLKIPSGVFVMECPGCPLWNANAIIFFFLLLTGLGYSTARATKLKHNDNPVLALLEFLALGLAAFILLTVVFGIVRIPVHFLSYGIIALLGTVWFVVADIRAGKAWSLHAGSWDVTRIVCIGVLIACMAGTFALFWSGANAYPYLENDDPWNHAQAALYVATEHTYLVDSDVRALNGGYAFYLEPYPPTFPVLMGVMRQLTDQTVWTLKMFTVLLIVLAVGFTYLLALALLKSDIKAAMATVVVTVIPSFMSHFIYSQQLGVVMMIAALYAVIHALSEPSWRIPAMIAVGAMLVTQPVSSFLFGVLLIIFVLVLLVRELTGTAATDLEHGTDAKHAAHAAKSHARKRETVATSHPHFLARLPLASRVFLIGAGGLALGSLYWIFQLVRHGFAEFMRLRGREVAIDGPWLSGYSAVKYSLLDITSNIDQSRIDQAHGWGWGIFILVVLSLIVVALAYRKVTARDGGWRYPLLLTMFLFFFYVVFAPTFGLPSMGASRAWPYLAFAVALLIGEGSHILATSISNLLKNPGVRWGVLVVLAVAIVWTSLPAKLAVQTAVWPPGVQWTAPQQEIAGYLAMRDQLPPQSRVYAFCSGDQRSIGFDMRSEPWDLDQAAFRKDALSKSPDEVVAFLERNSFEYVTFDATCIVEWGQNETVDFVNELSATGRFSPVINAQGFMLARFA
jgi:hypothetical protein